MAAKDVTQANKALGKRGKTGQDAAAPRTAAGGPVWKVLSIGSTIVATKIATSVAQRGWKVATGRTVPVKGDFERERTREPSGGGVSELAAQLVEAGHARDRQGEAPQHGRHHCEAQ